MLQPPQVNLSICEERLLPGEERIVNVIEG